MTIRELKSKVLDLINAAKSKDFLAVVTIAGELLRAFVEAFSAPAPMHATEFAGQLAELKGVCNELEAVAVEVREGGDTVGFDVGTLILIAQLIRRLVDRFGK